MAIPDVALVVTDASQAFVKFLGSRDYRSLLSDSTFKVIKEGGCHWAVCYPAARAADRREERRGYLHGLHYRRPKRYPCLRSSHRNGLQARKGRCDTG